VLRWSPFLRGQRITLAETDVRTGIGEAARKRDPGRGTKSAPRPKHEASAPVDGQIDVEGDFAKTVVNWAGVPIDMPGEAKLRQSWLLRKARARPR
jgi:hypothetical protein